MGYYGNKLAEKIKTSEIEKGLKLPRVKFRRYYNHWAKLVKKMKVGDSIFISGVTSNEVSSVYSAARRENQKVSLRQLDNGVRIWRVE